MNGQDLAGLKDVGRIAWIGAGKLGLPMAARIHGAGGDVVAFDTSAERMAAAKARGIAVASSIADAIAGARFVCTSLPDDKVMVSVAREALAAMAGDAILVELSTVSPEASAEVAKLARERGVAYLRAPVSGNPVLVEAGTASVIVSGPQAAYDVVRPALASFTRVQAWVGEAEQARYAKLAINLMIAASAGMMAEAMLLAEKGGLERGMFLDLVCDSAVGSPFVKYKAPPLKADDYGSTFTCRQMIKDIDLIVGAAQGVGVPVPLTALMRQTYTALIGKGYGDIDFIATVKLAEELSGGRET